MEEKFQRKTNQKVGDEEGKRKGGVEQRRGAKRGTEKSSG